LGEGAIVFMYLAALLYNVALYRVWCALFREPGEGLHHFLLPIIYGGMPGVFAAHLYTMSIGAVLATFLVVGYNWINSLL